MGTSRVDIIHCKDTLPQFHTTLPPMLFMELALFWGSQGEIGGVCLSAVSEQTRLVVWGCVGCVALTLPMSHIQMPSEPLISILWASLCVPAVKYCPTWTALCGWLHMENHHQVCPSQCLCIFYLGTNTSQPALTPTLHTHPYLYFTPPRRKETPVTSSQLFKGLLVKHVLYTSYLCRCLHQPIFSVDAVKEIFQGKLHGEPGPIPL